MWPFLASDCMFFGSLIATFMVYKGRSIDRAADPHEIFDIPYTSVSAFVLLMSSLTMVLALAAIQRSDQSRPADLADHDRAARHGLHRRPVLRVHDLLPRGLTLQHNLFGSSFFTLTGFHGAHVTIGDLAVLALHDVVSLARIAQERAASIIEIAGLYWHFVDIVWIVIFTVVYLMGTALAGGEPSMQLERAPPVRSPTSPAPTPIPRPRSTSGSRSS